MQLPTIKHEKIESPHGGTITQLAVTPDGTSAITLDDLGSFRLWPALDGSIEPRVTELPRPAQLVIGPDPRGFVIAMIDEAGGAVLQVTDRDGAMVQRATLPIEPAFAGLVMTDRGTLAWRTDQRIVRITSDGNITATLATDPGTRLLGIGVAHNIDRAIAALEGETDGKMWRRARWLAIGDKLAWGPWIPAGDDVGGVIAMSPSGKRFTYLTGAKPTFSIGGFDTTTGTDLGARQTASNATALAMIDEDVVVYSGISGTQLIELGPKLVRRGLPSRAVGELGVGGGHVFTANAAEIVISGRKDTKYLGYGLQTTHVATAAPGGKMLIGFGEFAALLDTQLASTPVDLVSANEAIKGARHLGANEWLVTLNKSTSTIVALVDLAARTRTELRTIPTQYQQGSMTRYDAHSQLIGLSRNDGSELLKHAPGALRADLVGSLTGPQNHRLQVWPVTPKLANGTQVVTTQTRDQLWLRWVPDARAPDKGASIGVLGSLSTVDATGKAYVWQNNGPTLELAMYRDGKKVGVFPIGDAAGALWPDPTGDRILATGNGKIVLFAADGTRTWTKSWKGVGTAVWLDDGTIGIVTAIGIARLDAKTGEPMKVRCGWSFGVTTRPHPFHPRAEPLCTQTRT